MDELAAELPLDGFEPGTVPIPLVDNLTNAELEVLNALLPWKCFITDSHGRRFGQRASATKRPAPNELPDRRIVMLGERFDLSQLTVLEIGCFEGVHTTALALAAKHVKACDSRIVNVVKTTVRCAMFQLSPTVFVWDVEKEIPPAQDATCDILHHVGVLYHLLDPVAHLQRIAPLVRRGLMLDTHHAAPEKATEAYTVGGTTYLYQNYREGGYADPFSGMYPTARWLRLQDLVAVLKSLGFAKVDVVEDRQERNGPRCLIIAERA